MSKIPTRSTTHRDVDMNKLAGLGLDLEEIAVGDAVALPALIELAEDNGKPPRHYLAALALATEFSLVGGEPRVVTVCTGKCQSWGALDVLDRAVERWQDAQKTSTKFSIAVRSCLDQCDKAAVVKIDSPDGTAFVTMANPTNIDEAITDLIGA